MSLLALDFNFGTDELIPNELNLNKLIPNEPMTNELNLNKLILNEPMTNKLIPNEPMTNELFPNKLIVAFQKITPTFALLVQFLGF